MKSPKRNRSTNKSKTLTVMVHSMMSYIRWKATQLQQQKFLQTTLHALAKGDTADYVKRCYRYVPADGAAVRPAKITPEPFIRPVGAGYNRSRIALERIEVVCQWKGVKLRSDPGWKQLDRNQSSIYTELNWWLLAKIYAGRKEEPCNLHRLLSMIGFTQNDVGLTRKALLMLAWHSWRT